MIKFTTNIETRIKFYFSIAGAVKEHDIIGSLCSTVASILPSYDIIALQTNKKVAQLKIDLFEHKVEKTNKIMTVGTLYVETNLDILDNSILSALIEMVGKVHIYDSKFLYKGHESTKEHNMAELVKRSKELYVLFNGNQKPDIRKGIKNTVLEGLENIKSKTLGAYTLGAEFHSSESIFIVEGRSDVLNLAEANYHNTIGIGGNSFVQSEIEELLRTKKLTLFMDADSGGHKNLLKLARVLDIIYTVPLEPGKKVQDLTKKELLEAIKNKQLFIKQSYEEAKIRPLSDTQIYTEVQESDRKSDS